MFLTTHLNVLFWKDEEDCVSDINLNVMPWPIVSGERSCDM